MASQFRKCTILAVVRSTLSWFATGGGFLLINYGQYYYEMHEVESSGVINTVYYSRIVHLRLAVLARWPANSASQVRVHSEIEYSTVAV
jgi:hypothetical protein